MFRWLRRTFLGLNPNEKKVKKLRPGSTFKYKGRGYRVRANGRAYAIDDEHDDFLELMFLLDIATDGVLDFDFGWTPNDFPDETASIPPGTMEAVAAQMEQSPNTIPFDSVEEDPKEEEPVAEVSSKDEFQLEQENERPSIEPYVPEPEPVKSYSPPPAPAYVPPDPEPSRSYSSGYDSGSSSYDSGGSSSYDSGGGGDCGGGGCD